jgi:hypothetical protein
MSPNEKLHLLQAEVVSYRKLFSQLEKVYGEILGGLYGPVDDRAREAIREELDAARNVALRYDILLERAPVKGEAGDRFGIQ